MFINLREYFPKHSENWMSHEGDVVYAREEYYKNKSPNLFYVIRKRYVWMNEYIKEDHSGIELGCGTGVGKDFIKSKKFVLTDVIENPWVEKKIDALNLPYDDNTLDFVICNNTIHHISHPIVALKGINRVLKVGGKLIIQDIYASLLTRIILFVVKHEGYSLNVDVFDPSKPCNKPDDPWSANCAISKLLFDDVEKFFKKVRGFKLIKKRFSEVFLLPLSGGIIAKFKTINLPFFLLKIFDLIDAFLTFCFPKLLAMQIQIVLEKSE